jgi:hypothetical protein
VTKKRKFKALELAGEELETFIAKLVEKLYNQVWADSNPGPEQAAIKERLRKSIIEALKEYTTFEPDER